MEWVKLSTRYYLDTAVASLPDAETELLFVRSLAYSGAEETGGFIPEVIVPSLIRRRRYGAAVEALVARSLWVPSTGDRGQPGYRITRWEDWQEELDVLARRRANDRERKRKQRQAERESAQVNAMSRDMSTDCHVTVRTLEREEEKDKELPPARPTGSLPPKGAARATRIPDDFTVTPEMVAWARQNVPNVDGRRETERFIDHWQAASGANARKRDWTAAWRNWMRRADDDLGGRANGSRRPSPQQETDDLFDRAFERAKAREEMQDEGYGNGSDRAPYPRALPAAAD